MNKKIIIPARYKSSRFPGKPLADINGKSMLRLVWEKCSCVASEDDILIATDNSKIKDHCDKNGLQVVMTSSNCLTGTDRVAEVAKIVDADIYINVQGDEPLINPQDIKYVIDEGIKYPKKIINCMCPIKNENDFFNVNVPKVVFAPNGELLYMSRAAIPANKTLTFFKAFKQVCIYSFPKEALLNFATVSSKTNLESIEDIEILRFLELGYKVHMIKVSDSSIAVDTPEDLNRVKKILIDSN